ncbi:unnamed protein product [Arabidopsis thaliana]|uniref:(thale cress) hypothetical protein n=1 Tax=Arabidopsis thaliana TaxID=3702 RepID=A0A7G2FIV5_ARATH|nr:unnamed protein product [Arabidopsis thaliana]
MRRPKSSRVRMEPVAPRSHNTMPMLDQFRSNHPETSKIEGVSSLDTALKVFWNNQREQLGNFAGQTHLPLSRVRKILKSDPEVKKISCDVPALFSKACEYFILEAVKNSGTYDFLIDRVPFGPHCVTHQGVQPPAEMILPDMNVPIDMDQIEEENIVEERSVGFDLNSDLQ